MKVIYSKRTNVRKIAGVFIVPGVNVLEDDQAAKVLASPDFAEDSNITLKSEGEAQGTATGAQGETETAPETKLNAKDMIAAVKEMQSVKKLETLLEDEDRSSVIKAINKRIEKIKEEREAGEGEDDNE